MGSRTDNVDLAELQKRRQKTLERLEGKPVEKAKPNSNNRPVIPRGGVGQLNLGLLDPGILRKNISRMVMPIYKISKV
ncbi:hypothetical protein [Modicisalibacter luteus]|uniref:hypothetical protein n=1 Tax=Modicisalibacter luteus TaxID=453962 RepID=UPI00363C7CF5